MIETDVIETLEAVKPEREQAEEKVPRGKPTRWIALGVLAIAIAAVSVWWWQSLRYESTDDAQVDGHIDLVSARISGTVTYIDPRVENNQLVEAGTLLVELDPRDYEAELEHARANLNARTAESRSAQVTVPIVDASAFGQLHAAEAPKPRRLQASKRKRRIYWLRGTNYSRTMPFMPAPKETGFGTWHW